MVSGSLNLDVEPLHPQVLDGIAELKVEVVGFGPRRDDSTANIMDGRP
jgi:predicted subunit of tRNA(5-methylaminomethyl-2-thiouridylate) methyltransferase